VIFVGPHWIERDNSCLLLDLPPDSLYRLLRLDTFQFPSRLSIEENKEFIVLSFAILLAFLSKHASDLRNLPLCDEFGFELMTLEAFPRAARAVIGSASPVIEAVLNLRDAAHDEEEVAVAHAFLEKVCLYTLDNAMKIAIKSLPDTPAGRQRKVILDNSVMVGVPPELVLEEKLLTQPLLMRPPSRLQHSALQQGFLCGFSFNSAASKQSSQFPEDVKRDFLSDLAGVHIADSPRRILKPSTTGGCVPDQRMRSQKPTGHRRRWVHL
jgi:hypothetical protein